MKWKRLIIMNNLLHLVSNCCRVCISLFHFLEFSFYLCSFIFQPSVKSFYLICLMLLLSLSFLSILRYLYTIEKQEENSSEYIIDTLDFVVGMPMSSFISFILYRSIPMSTGQSQHDRCSPSTVTSSTRH
jgi:hypothetical protein